MIGDFFRRVLVGADGTERSQFAIDAAITVAKQFNSELHCIGVIPPPSPETEAEGVGLEQLKQFRASIREQLRSCEDEARAAGIQVTTELLDGDAESVIEAYALKSCIDMIVVGHHHMNRLRRLLEGSTSEGLIEHASSSILVVRAPSEKS
jgi:nucleotide-binding universal stress UspA family protein